jgi:hypothetical protein
VAPSSRAASHGRTSSPTIRPSHSNEAAGYGTVALTAFASGFIAERWGLRPAPFLLGLAYAGLGLGLSTIFVRETRGHARYEAGGRAGSGQTGALTTTSWWATTDGEA